MFDTLSIREDSVGDALSSLSIPGVLSKASDRGAKPDSDARVILELLQGHVKASVLLWLEQELTCCSPNDSRCTKLAESALSKSVSLEAKQDSRIRALQRLTVVLGARSERPIKVYCYFAMCLRSF